MKKTAPGKTRKSATKKTAAKQKAAPAKATKQAPARKAPAKKAPANKATKQVPAKKHGPRADLGAPIEGFFAKQPAATRPILEKLRSMVEEAAPEAKSSLKWGMPFYEINGTMMCALGGHRAHVNLILSGPPGSYADPQGQLEGDGKTGRRLKLTALDELPLAAVRGWLKAAAALARKG